jgi:phosphotransferase system IIB component
MTIQFYILIVAAIVFVVLLIFTIFHINYKRVHRKTSKLELGYLNQLYEAIGGNANIVKTGSEHQRLQITVNETKAVNADMLRYLNIPAFVKGKQITLLIKDHTNEVLSFLNDRRKEDN